MRPFLPLLAGALILVLGCASNDPTPEQMLPDVLPTKGDVRAAYGVASDVRVVQTSDRYLPNDHRAGRFAGHGDNPTASELEGAGRVTGYVGAYNLYAPMTADRVSVALDLYADAQSASDALTGFWRTDRRSFDVADLGDEAFGWPAIIADTSDGREQFLCTCDLTFRVGRVVASVSINDHLVMHYEGLSAVQESIARVVAARIRDEFGDGDTLS